MTQKIGENPAKVQIDQKDIAILKILENEGRIPILELAKRVKLSHETVRYRINKLVRQGVIQKFGIKIDKRKLGYNFLAVVMLATWNYTKAEWNEFVDFLMTHDTIVSVAKITGDYDFKFAFWARNPDEFEKTTQEIKTRFSKIIKDWQTFIFTKQYKYKELPF